MKKMNARRVTVLAFCLLFLAVSLPTLVQTPAEAGTPMMNPIDDGGGADPGTGSSAGNQLEGVLIRTAKPYAGVVTAIEQAGGIVSHQYKYFDGIAARVPRASLRAIGLLTGPERITKDLIIAAPAPRESMRGPVAGLKRISDGREFAFDSVRAIAAPELASILADHPEAYSFNNTSTNVDALLADGITGNGVIVAVIDSGLVPGVPHIGGSVVGCEDFVDDGNGCSHPGNSGHGTFVAGLISANVLFAFPAGGFLQAVSTHLPGSVIAPNLIPMVGSAPLSSIYALRVFGPSGGSPTSVILAAIDRAIELRDLFDAGAPGGANIQVVNMSLGGPSLFAGRDLFDTAVDALLDHDIVHVNSASNDGPSGISIGSPGSAFGAITTGAASLVGHERILRDLQNFPGAGFGFRPTTHMQTATFSSRGPHADGRNDPDVTASGFASFGQGFSGPGGINIASGTSFSSPTVAGIAALLRQAFPAATAIQIRNAIINSANPNLLGDNSTAVDQGNGYVDAQAARLMLAAGGVPDFLPTPPTFGKSVKVNLETNAGLNVQNGNISRHVGPLKPGERGEIYYRVGPNTAQVVISISNFSASLLPPQQNPFFGDDIFFRVHDAKTSNLQGTAYFGFPAFIRGGTFVINDPETGVIRITPSGDWTNAGDVEMDVSVFSIANPLPGSTDSGKVAEFDQIVLPLIIPAGISVAEFRLSWREGWGRYPINDVDLILFDPNGGFNADGGTLNSPEVAVINNPIPGMWFILIHGFEFHTDDDKYELRVTLDGNLVH